MKPLEEQFHLSMRVALERGPSGIVLLVKQNLQFTALHELDEVREKDVSISLTEAVDVVRHLRLQIRHYQPVDVTHISDTRGYQCVAQNSKWGN